MKDAPLKSDSSWKPVDVVAYILVIVGALNWGSRIVAMSFCEPRSWTRVLSS